MQFYKRSYRIDMTERYNKIPEITQYLDKESKIIKDSIHIPISEIQNRMHDFNEDETIVFICHHGVRSRMVGNYFQQNDYENIINLRGGIDSWAKTVDNQMAVY